MDRSDASNEQILCKLIPERYDTANNFEYFQSFDE